MRNTNKKLVAPVQVTAPTNVEPTKELQQKYIIVKGTMNIKHKKTMPFRVKYEDGLNTLHFHSTIPKFVFESLKTVLIAKYKKPILNFSITSIKINY